MDAGSGSISQRHRVYALVFLFVLALNRVVASSES